MAKLFGAISVKCLVLGPFSFCRHPAGEGVLADLLLLTFRCPVAVFVLCLFLTMSWLVCSM